MTSNYHNNMMMTGTAGAVLSMPMPESPLRVIHRNKLSSRETETLNFVSQGMTTNDIAMQLNLSPETIETHRKNILRKLRVNNIVHAVAFGLRNKLIE